jgi:hypothetical protein
MNNKKLWLFPVIVFSTMMVFEIDTVYSAYDDMLRERLLSFRTFFWPVWLLIEVLNYILLRKKLYNRSWVILHTSLALLFFSVIPFTIALLPLYFSITELRRVYSWWSYSFWLRMATAHLFFILTIVKSFSKPNGDETPGLLDAFIS